MIQGLNLSFSFGGKTLYRGISFTLEPGQHCALIGSNGTGKTTLAGLIRNPEDYLFEGKLLRQDVGRIGLVTQFSPREKGEAVQVVDYLREDFLRLQRRTEQVCAAMGEAEGDALDALLEDYQQLLDESESMDADHYESNIRLRLHEAGLSDWAELEIGKLSGGEYKLVQIIRQMLLRPGLLIMDEPDVFLDFENLIGLAGLINAYDGTVLVITHSRYLLSQCFDRIWHLENCILQEFEGNFRQYNYARLGKKIELTETAGSQEEEIRRAEEMVERLRKQATEVIDPLRGRTLKGKVSYLGRLLAQQILPPFVDVRQPEITMPEFVPSDDDTPLLQAENYELKFDRQLLEQVSFCVRPGEKVALVGANGTGKTTLLRQAAEQSSACFTFRDDVRLGVFSQLQDEIAHEQSTVAQLLDALGVEREEDAAQLLERYRLDPQLLSRQTDKLSGGERNLLQLAMLSLSPANLLLLDEPSSHLDTYAQIALEKAVKGWEGAVLMVSHDFYTIANCADTILLVENGTLRPMSGRAFRKMIYKRHFGADYLALEQRRQELEQGVERALAQKDPVRARQVYEQLGAVLDEL